MASGKVTGITWGFTAREQNSTDASRFTRVFEFRNIENYKIDEKLVGFCPQKLQSETFVCSCCLQLQLRKIKSFFI